MAVSDRRRTAPPAPAGDPEDVYEDRCDVCETPLRHGQEWCLECGAARTLIHRPPDWRVPLAIVVVIVALALAGFAFALVRLTDSANHAAANAVAPAAAARR
jgi:hypothetical protein